MIIKLSGYNVESELLENLAGASPEAFTPETLSAAYARISRSPKDIISLRRKAREDVAKARKSNEAIIFDMGHHSVAEHAVFNFDIIGVSRLALEEIEQFRLVSFTEKSQRYVTLKGDYLVPEEIKDADSRALFNDTVALQNAFYQKAFDGLKDYIFKNYPDLAKEKSRQKTLEGWAKEDARYILSLATEGQVGMTINARNLEHLFRRFHLSRRAEVKAIGQEMYRQVKKIAPSIILFSEPSNFSRDLDGVFPDNFDNLVPEMAEELSCHQPPRLVGYTANGDDLILAAFLAVYKGLSYSDALHVMNLLEPKEKEEIFLELFKRMEFFDSVPRPFELPCITFQAAISASNFAQLKRHRMATLLTGNYEPRFGNMVPENINAIGLEKEFLEIIKKTNGVYETLKEKYGATADYILTNSHCRMVIMKMNLREVYHFMRLRDDDHAQWEIRQLAHQLLEQVKTVMPFSTMLLGGKSDFTELFESIYERKPDFLI